MLAGREKQGGAGEKTAIAKTHAIQLVAVSLAVRAAAYVNSAS